MDSSRTSRLSALLVFAISALCIHGASATPTAASQKPEFTDDFNLHFYPDKGKPAASNTIRMPTAILSLRGARVATRFSAKARKMRILEGSLSVDIQFEKRPFVIEVGRAIIRTYNGEVDIKQDGHFTVIKPLKGMLTVTLPNPEQPGELVLPVEPDQTLLLLASGDYSLSIEERDERVGDLSRP